MRRIRFYIVALSALGVILLTALMPVSAFAFDAFQDACDPASGAIDSSVCQDNSANKGSTLLSNQGGIIPKIANMIALVGGIIALVFIMINGLTIITSTGDSAKINKARDGLIYAAVGLVIIIMARVIVALITRYI